MAINEQIRDLENYPSKVKTVILDLQKVVPIDNQGDEVYVLTSSGASGSTSNKTNGTTINPIYVRESKSGYFKSSGFKNPPFAVTTTGNTFRISIDGSSLRDVVLTTGTGLQGGDIAADMQTQINALAASGAVEAGNTSYLNATVEFVNNRFRFISGSLSNTYTGPGKSSVNIYSGSGNDCSTVLGLDIGHSSDMLSAKKPVESTVSVAYSGGNSLYLNSTVNMSAHEAYTICDGAKREYFVTSGVDVGVLGMVNTLSGSYGLGSVVQKIYERDPDGGLASPYEDVDALTRFLVRSIANQINFAV